MTPEEEAAYRRELEERWGITGEEADLHVEGERSRRENEDSAANEDGSLRGRDPGGYHDDSPEPGPYDGTPWGGGASGDGSRQSGFDASSEDIPIWSWLSGAGQRQDRRRAERARQDRLRTYGNLYGLIPGEAYLEEDSAAAKAESDAQAIEAQRRALIQLQEQAQGRYSDIDRARQEQMLSRNAMQERAQREAALSQMQARGMGRSGTAVTAALMAGQQGANRSSAEAMQLEALAQQRALQAMNSSAGLAGQMRGQQFDENYRRGSALDDFNRRNVDRRNQFQQTEFENRQGVTDRATGVISEVGASAEKRAEQGDENLWAALGTIAELS